MTIDIASIAPIGGNPPTHIRITGKKTGCERFDIWLKCNDKTPPGASDKPTFISPAGASNAPFAHDVPNPCGCGETAYIWVDCHPGAGVSSPQVTPRQLVINCDDCCPTVALNAPVITGAPAAVQFSLALPPITWTPAGCMPQPAPTGFTWTVKDAAGQHQYKLTTTAPAANTSVGAWTSLTGAPTTVPLTLPPGAWSVKVKANFPGSLLSSCDPTDDMPFMVPGMPICCPAGDPMTAPRGVSIATAVTGVAPNVTATFTATVFWPGNCVPVTPTGYKWVVTDPTGVKYIKDSSTSTTDSSTGWYSNNVPVGAIQLTVSGTYDVQVGLDFTSTSALGCVAYGDSRFQIMGVPPAMCCPTVGLNTVINGPMATFTATSEWPMGCPNVTPTNFTWAVLDRSTGQSFVKTTTTSTTDSTGFTPPLTLSPGATYDVSVAPLYPGVTLPPGCNSSSAPTAVTPAPPPVTPTRSPTACPWWCWVLGLLFVAIPISAFISSVAGCWLPWWGATIAAAAIAFAIVIFTRICGVCCLWIIIVIGLALAVIATIIALVIAAYYGQPPNWLCVFAAASLWIGFAVAAYAFKLACDAMASPTSSGSSASSSSGLTSSDDRKTKKKGTYHARESTPAIASTAARVGLGDVIAGTAAAMGARPCTGCDQRRQALNNFALALPTTQR